MMDVSDPVLTTSGVSFTVIVDCIKHDCVISTEALIRLSSSASDITDPLQTFHAYEARIKGVARRMIAANVKGHPLHLGARTFY